MKSIFITVRTGSTRLKNKCLLEIDGLSSIEYLIRRLKNSKNADHIVLCTSDRQEDDVLIEIASTNKIDFFRGSETDKLARWHGACEHYNTDFFVTADGDDPFCEPSIIDLAFNQYERNNSSFIEAKNIICGAFTNGISASAVNKVCEIKGTKDTEMIWPYFKETNLFNIEQLEFVDEKFYRDDIRLTLDYQEDLDFMNALIDKKPKNVVEDYFSLEDIVTVIDQNKELLDINFFRHKEWAENQAQKTQLVLGGKYE